MNRLITLTLCIAITGILVLTGNAFKDIVQKTNAQSCCNPPLLPFFAPKWPQNYYVTVSIQSGTFTETERQIIEKSFLSWNSSESNNCTHVTFHGFQFADAPTFADGSYWVEFRDENLGAAGLTHMF